VSDIPGVSFQSRELGVAHMNVSRANDCWLPLVRVTLFASSTVGVAHVTAASGRFVPRNSHALHASTVIAPL
jgi:hypothetical protein